MAGKQYFYKKKDLDAWREKFKLSPDVYCEESASLYIGKNSRYLAVRVSKHQHIPEHHVTNGRRYYKKEHLDLWRVK